MTQPPAVVPSDVAQVAHLYGALIRTTIRKSCDRKCLLPVDELDDLMQHVYLKMIERNFLSRCETYLTVHPEKSFVLSLITFTRNLTSNYLRDRGRRVSRFPLYDDFLCSTDGWVGTGIRVNGGEVARAMRRDNAVPSYENRILARQYLGEIAGFLMGEPDMLAVIDAALQAGGTLAASAMVLHRYGRVLNEKTVRRYIRRLKDRVREVAA